MAQHKATITWTSTATPEDFSKGKYSREHSWVFDGGVTVRGSASQSVVPAPWSSPAAVDPEEAFVAAISSCHMLTFVYLAQKAGFVVDAYEDHAVGTMTKSAWGGAKRPTDAEEAHLHHEAHEQCFIAQSVKTEITVAHPS